MSNLNLERFKKNAKYLVFDFETENLNLVQKNRPWQLSYLICEGEKIIQERDYYIWWEDLNISKAAARVTRFDYAKYKSKAIDPKNVLDDFDKYLYDPSYKIIGHNLLGFDIYVHNNFRKALNRKTDWSYLDRLIDTKALSMCYRLNSIPGDDILPWMFKMVNFVQKGVKTNLGAMGKEFDIQFDYESTHDGIQDVKLNFLVWNRLKWQVDI